jgi:hypothetical protein
MSLKIYNVKGEVVKTLLSGFFGDADGPYAVTWRGLDNTGKRAANGFYIVRLKVQDRIRNQTILMLK